MQSKFTRFLCVALTLVLVLTVSNLVFAADVPPLPTAAVKEITNEDLTFAMNFTAKDITPEQVEYYGDWYADFELTFSKDVTMSTTDESADGYLSGQYDSWSPLWVDVPGKAPVTLKANEPLRIMSFAAEYMGEPGLKYTCAEVFERVKDFDCGVYLTDEYIQANPDVVINLELKIYNPENEAECYVIGDNYQFSFGFVAKNVQTGKLYTTVADAIREATADQTVQMIADSTEMNVTVFSNVKLDLAGNTLTTNYFTSYGNTVDSSADSTGRVAAIDNCYIYTNNVQLPIRDNDGYMFVDVQKINNLSRANNTEYHFQPFVERVGHKAMLAGTAASDLTVQVQVTWTGSSGTGSQDFVFNDEQVALFLNSYVLSRDRYNKMFSLTLNNAEQFTDLRYNARLVSGTGAVISVDSLAAQVANNTLTQAVTLEGASGSAVVPAGTLLESGTSALTLTATEMTKTTSNITVGDGESLLSMDVCVEGVSKENTTPILVTLDQITLEGLNIGNIALYHVENGVTTQMTRVFSIEEVDAHNEFYYDIPTGTITMALKSFSEVAVVANEVNTWNGEINTGWYNDTDTAFEIFNADQLAGLGKLVDEGNTFAGKTVTLCLDVKLSDGSHSDTACISFNPIGFGYAYDTTNGKAFEGTFDGNGNTVYGLYQNCWQMGADTYTYSTAGGGLFASVNNATIKNLTMDNAYIVMECIDMGTVVGYAQGDCTFENIVVKNSTLANYQRYTGGAIGEVSNGHHVLKNVDVEASTTVSSLWGDFDASLGGIIGGKWGHNYNDVMGIDNEATGAAQKVSVSMENCDVAAVLNAYNDVTSAYQWYSYRRCGMLIGHTEESKTVNGRTEATASYLETVNCTVQYGDWVNYTYCRFSNTTSLSARYPWVRVQSSEFNGAYSNPRYGVPTFDGAELDIDTHTTDANCHVEADNPGYHNVTIQFNQLYGGGQGCYGGNTHVDENLGVTVIGQNGNPVTATTKFTPKDVSTIAPGTITLGDLFTGTNIIDKNVYAFVSPADENSEVKATSVGPDIAGDWTQYALNIEGTGRAKITISDYYYCIPTVMYVTVGEEVVEPVEKFASKFTGDFLYRVGNNNAVTLSSLFQDSGLGTIDNANVSVTVEAQDGTGASGAYTANTTTWNSGSIKFSGTGLVKVTITDNDNCIPTELYLEVVNGKNLTTAAENAQSNNMVLLNNVSLGDITVSGGHTIYGNGFTMTRSGDTAALNRYYGFVTLENGTLDNVKIITPSFSHQILYDSNKSENDNPTQEEGTKIRYYNIRSAVLMTGESKILNSYVSGGRAAVYVTGGNAVIDNSTIDGGAAANIHIESTQSVLLRDITLIQEPRQATVNDTSKTVMGLSIFVLCDDNGMGSPITLEGTICQYAWAHEGYKNYVPAGGESVIDTVMNQKQEFVHSITYADGTEKDSVNLGIAYMSNSSAKAPVDPVANGTLVDNRIDKATKPYAATDINGSAYVYSYENSNGTAADTSTKPTYTANTQVASAPTVTYTDANDDRVFETSYSDQTGWTSTLKVDVDQGDYAFSFDKLLAQKYGKNLSYTVEDANGNEVDKNAAITLRNTSSTTYTLIITDDQLYDQAGNLTGETYTHTHTFQLVSTKTSISAPEWVNKTLSGTPYIVVTTKNSDWNCAVPVLEGLKVKYYSKKQGKEVELNLADVVTAAGLSAGLQNGTNNSITITVADEYTLTITSSGFKTADNGKPVVVNDKLYFTVSTSSNFVSTKTTSRAPSFNYTFTDANNTQELTHSTSMTVTYATYKDNQYSYSDFCNGTLKEASGGCVTPDTLVTLADGTQKQIQYITDSDMLMAWDHFTGKYTAVPAAIIFDHGYDDNTVIQLNFSDGTTLKVVNLHQLLNADQSKYVTISAETVAQYVGSSFVKRSGEGYTTVTLDSYSITQEYIEAYGIISALHYNILVEDMISTDFMEEDYPLFNYFQIGSDLKYDADKMAADIEAYGLYTYEDFAGYLTEEQFDAFNVQYMKISVGKGVYTFQQILNLINEYLN